MNIFLKMRNNIFFKVTLFNITLIVLCIFNLSSGQVIRNLGLNEGQVCRASYGLDQEYVCTSTKHCKIFKESIRTRNYLDTCKIVGSKLIVCCPVIANERLIEIPESRNAVRQNSAEGRCYKYTKPQKFHYIIIPDEFKSTDNEFYDVHESRELLKLNHTHHLLKIQHNRLFGGSSGYAAGAISAEELEFPHMALIGFGATTRYANDWKCGGSLISERWILTAAHCQHFKGNFARWARLGVLTRVINERNIHRAQDFKIVQHVIHPGYKPPSLYNDIALFRLEKNVKFSDNVRPICLNSDPFLTPLKPIVTGWGRTSTAGPLSETLLKVNLDIFPIQKCNESYFSKNNLKYRYGIFPDSMICAGSFDGTRDSCSGDSGGPLQAEHDDLDETFIQYGITSLGKTCADKNTPAVYTRVAKYISWIEEIAFSNN